MNEDESAQLSRRSLLTSGAAGAMAVGLGADSTLRVTGAGIEESIYQQLGVRTVINAAGTITALGGSIMPPEVLAAWSAAARCFVNLLELQDRVGERIAARIGVESALVTTGAAGAILLGTAACITHRNRELVGSLPLPSEMGLEVIRQSSHHACYDQQVRACGVQLLDVQTTADLERAISPRTVMMFSYNINEPDGQISHPEWLNVARAHGIPTLLDAAADTPPSDALHKYNQLGFDLVAFSGGKAIRGPQDAGLLLGRKHLIDAAKINTSPHCGSIGRALKVSKEDMVAMWAAVERFVSLDQDALRQECEQRLLIIERRLADIPTLTTQRIVPPIANQFPHLLLFWDQQKLDLTYGEMKQRLAEGSLAIATARVHGTGDDGFLISVFTLQVGEAELVGARLHELLTNRRQ